MKVNKATVNAQLSAIESIKTEFLNFCHISGAPSPSELKERHERIKAALADCGGSLDEYWVIWLFGELEQRAVEELRKVTLLAQTTDPEALKDKHFPELNKELVDNVEILKKYHQDTGMSIKGNTAKGEKKKSVEEEIIHRAEYFIKNPEPDYKLKIENYRSSTLAECVKNNWGNSEKIQWRNNNFPDVPSLIKIQRTIKTAVDKKILPSFLLGGKPKK